MSEMSQKAKSYGKSHWKFKSNGSMAILSFFSGSVVHVNGWEWQNPIFSAHIFMPTLKDTFDFIVLEQWEYTDMVLDQLYFTVGGAATVQCDRNRN